MSRMKKMGIDRVKDGLLFLVLTPLFWMIVPPAIILLFSPFYLYRFLVIFLQKLIHPDWVGILDLYDGVMSEPYNKKRSNYLSVSIHVMSGSPNLEKIRQGFLEKIYLQKNSKGQYPYEKFSYYLKGWLGFRFWKKDRNFNVENHIKLIRLKTPNQDRDRDGEISSSDCYVQLPDDFSQDSYKTLEKISEERLYKSIGDDAMTTNTSQFPENRSPWELLILPNYYPKSKENQPGKNKKLEKETGNSEFFVIILRFQHTLFDGFSLKKMITVNLSGEKMGMGIEPDTEKPKTSRFNFITLQGLIHLPMQMLRFKWLDRDENDWHISPEKLSENWHSVVVDPIPFDIVRSVGKKIGVSPHTVVFGALDGAIQRMWKLQNKYEKLPKQMRAPFPWSIEGHPMDGLVNHWSYAEFQLPLSSAKSQKERLLILEEQFQRLKRLKMPELLFYVGFLFESLPIWLMDYFLASRQPTLTVSNFPGPRNQLTFLQEWPLEEWTFCVPKARCASAFQIAVMSYRGWIRIVLTVNTAVMPSYKEVQQFGQCIKEELLDLEKMIK